MHWYVDVLKKYATFSGRARRMEFWMFSLLSFLVSIFLGIVDVVILGVEPMQGNALILTNVYGLAVLLPSLAVTARRLHDTDRTGWWILIILIPLLGPLVLLVFLVLNSKPEENKYGPNPKEAAPVPATA